MDALVLTQISQDFASLYTRDKNIQQTGPCRMAESADIQMSKPLNIMNLKINTTSPLKNTDKSSANWITAIAFAKFDISKGNVVEAIYPENILSTCEQKTVSLLSFPDSASFSADGGLKFVFKFKREDYKTTGESLFGYVFFRQTPDPTNPRGSSQKSIVILSALPFSGFFKSVLSVLGNRYFDELNANIECSQFLKESYDLINNEWPKAQSGSELELSLYGKKLNICLPNSLIESKHIGTKSIQVAKSDNDSRGEVRSFGSVGSPDKPTAPSSNGESDDDEMKENIPSPTLKKGNSLCTILTGHNLQKGCFQDVNLYKIFKGSRLPYLWKLWELVLTNQPLMIMSDLPSECSEAVLGLLSTICPLEYQTEYKPYFTIYDPEYRQIQDLYDKKVAKCAILGVTNPLFMKVMQNYPNIFHLEKEYMKYKRNKNALVTNKFPLLESLQKTFTLPDPALKHMFMPVDSEETDAINNVLLRKSLQTLTENFLGVFQTYFKLQVNEIKKFEEKDFIKFLETQKLPFREQFKSQADIQKLYAKFLKSANFNTFIKGFPNVYIVKST